MENKRRLRMNRRAFVIYAILIFLAVAGPLWQWHEPLVPSARRALLPPPVPKLSPPPAAELLKDMLAHNLWSRTRGRIGATANAGQGKRNRRGQSGWSLKAVAYAQTAAPVAMIVYDAAPETVHAQHEGDLLPDGSQLTKIFPDGVMVEKDGRRMFIYMFGKKAPEEKKLDKETAVKQHVRHGHEEKSSERQQR